MYDGQDERQDFPNLSTTNVPSDLFEAHTKIK